MVCIQFMNHIYKCTLTASYEANDGQETRNCLLIWVYLIPQNIDLDQHALM